MAPRSRIKGRCLLVLIAALLGASVSPSRAQDENGFEKWKGYLFSNEPAKKIVGAHQLLALPEERGLAELRRILTDPAERADVAIAVLEAIGIDQDLRLVREMLAALGDPRSGVPEAARAAFGAFRSERGQEMLAALLALHDDAAEPTGGRVRAVRAIGHTRSMQAVGPLIERLGGGSPELAEAIVAALAEITRQRIGGDAAAWRTWWEGDPEKGQPSRKGWTREQVLEEALDRARDVRLEDVEAKLSREVIPLVQPTSIEELQLAIDSSLAPVRAFAAAKLGALRGDRAAGILLARLEKERSPVVLAELATSLGSLQETRAVAPLVAILADAYARRRPNPGFHEEEAALVKALLGSLSELRDRRAVPEVAKIATDPTIGHPMRGQAVDTLGKLGGDEAFAVLLSLAQSEKEVEILRKVAPALRIGGAQAVDPLLVLLAHADPPVRCNAADSLARLKDPRTLEPLLGRLADPFPRVRQAAVYALGEFGGEAAVEPIGKLLAEDPDALVRLESADALKKLKHPGAIRALVASQGDAKPEVRQKGWDALVECMGEDRGLIRQAAAAFLERGDRPDRAAELYRRLLPGAAAEHLGAMVDGLGRALVEMGEPGAAASELAPILEKLPAADPSFWAAHMTRARALALAGRPGDARAALAALAGQPGHADRIPALSALEGSLDALAAGSAAFQASRLLSRIDLDDALRADRFRAAGKPVVRALEVPLASGDPIKVWAAVRVLRALSGTAYGFDPARPLPEQAAEIDKWREWVRNQ